MKNPQTTAEEIKDIKHIESISKYGCCGFVALWTIGVDPDNDIEAIRCLSDAMEAGVLESDCTVKWVEFYKWLTGRTVEVEFVNISSIKSIKRRTPVRFDYNGSSHWVGVEDGEVRFNSLKHSVCVEKGKPVTARIIKINGKQV